MDDLLKDLRVTSRIARRGGREAKRKRGELHGRTKRRDYRMDFVSDADEAAEHIIVSALKRVRRFRHDAIDSEEGGHRGGRSGRCWIIDPLDGSTNRIRDIGPFAVGICRLDAGVLTLGVVHLPHVGKTFAAGRGTGLFINGKRQAARPDGPGLGGAIIESFLVGKRVRQSPESLGALHQSVAGTRSFGATLVALPLVAAGNLDGCVGMAQWLEETPWDWLPGQILCEESGVVVGRAGPHLFAAGRGCADELAACLSEPSGPTGS